MGWPVYTERFLVCSRKLEWVGWVVPAGKRAVVKSLIVSNWGGVGVDVYVNMANTCVYSRKFQAAMVTDALALTQVCYAGERIECWNTTDTVSVAIAGFLFDEAGPHAGTLPTTDPDHPPAPPTRPQPWG